MYNYSYRDVDCKNCGCNIYYKRNKLCVKCNPTNREARRNVRDLQIKRRRIEEHQQKGTSFSECSFSDAYD